ncbi:UNVERIFIED_CONTAM: putative mitochondrial protein [Sesamum indicum]
MVEWDFLFVVLRLYKFPKLFIGWIRECVTTTIFTIALNGGIHGFFAGARGLRQGDPMSPYLFVLVTEILGLIIQQKIESQGGFRYHWRCEETRLFQLSFADDLLLFCRADASSIWVFKEGLDNFSSLSGLHTNAAKTSVQLIKSVLISLQIYWAMPFILPKGVIKEIEKRFRQGASTSGYLKVSWDQVCRPVEEGGQGIMDVAAVNQTLMSRHI